MTADPGVESTEARRTVSEDMERPIKLVYIAGYPRSGSTLLLRLLGAAPGYFAIGELHEVWLRSFIEDQLCGCGRSFSECDFWEQVVAPKRW